MFVHCDMQYPDPPRAEILPPGRRTISYDLLAQLVSEHILLTALDVDVSEALSMMPLTTSEY